MLRFALPGVAIVGLMMALLAGAMETWPGQQQQGPAENVAAQPLAEAANPPMAPADPGRAAPAQAEPAQPAPAPVADAPPASPATAAAQPAPPAAPAPARTAQLDPAPVAPAARVPPLAAAPPARPVERRSKPAAPVLARHAVPDQDAAAVDSSESFASVESLLRRLRVRHAGSQETASVAPPAQTAPAAPPMSAATRLAQARALLVSSNLQGAREALEAAAAQLVLRPVQPGQVSTQIGPNPAAQAVNDALGWLNAGQPARALSLVNDALAELPRQYGAANG